MKDYPLQTRLTMDSVASSALYLKDPLQKRLGIHEQPGPHVHAPSDNRMNQAIQVRPVLNDRDRQIFLQVPFTVYKHDPAWIAPLNIERKIHISPNSNPFFRHAEAQLFIAERGGEPVGLISAQIDHLHIDRYHDATGHFGFIEAIDDFEVFQALFALAENWLRARGMVRIEGPFSFSINDEMGLLVDGFEFAPSMMMGHARPYYAKYIDALGYTKEKDVFAYYLKDTGELPRTLASTYKRAMRAPEIKVRPVDMRKLDQEIATLLSIHTDAWSNNWGFIPLTLDEITDLGNVLKWLVKPEYVAIAEYEGEPAAMAVSVPNINDWVKDLHGKINPLGAAKLLWRIMRPPQSVRFLLMGVRKKFHSSLLGSSLALVVIENVRRYHVSRGTTSGELSWILEDNMPVRSIIEQFGGKPYKTYRVFGKFL